MPDPPPPTAEPAHLRAAVIAAAQEFNAGRYFEAHEKLEEHLDDVPDELWELFIGLIQIAVGYHKVSQGLLSAAAAMFEKALLKVEAFPPQAGGINLEGLRARVREDVEALRQRRFDTPRFTRDPPRLQPLPGGSRRS